MSSQKSMPVTISSTIAQRKFGDLARRVFSGREHFIVERDGLPIMAILSMTEYQELMKEHEEQEKEKEERLKRFKKVARKIGEAVEKSGLTEEELMAELEKDKHSVYQRYYAKTPKR